MQYKKGFNVLECGYKVWVSGFYCPSGTKQVIMSFLSEMEQKISTKSVISFLPIVFHLKNLNWTSLNVHHKLQSDK